MYPIRLAVTCCALMTPVLLSACTDSSTESDDVVRIAEETSSTTTGPSTRTSAPEPTYTYTSAPGEVFLLPKDSDFGTMGAGRYEAWRIGSPVHYEVDVPEGWRVLAGTYLNAPTDGHGIFFVASLPNDRTDLAKHPCRDHTLFRVGPSVRDFVRAMQEQPVWEVSTPRPVTLDGKKGLYFEIELPSSVDPADCVKGSVSEWESGRNGMATTQSYRGRWWVLDVDEERLVVMARCYDTCSERDLDTMSAMAASITFQRG
jgi:hypothetical protein